MKLKKEIPFSSPKNGYTTIKEEIDEAYRRVMESGQYIMGSELAGFEKEFADYCGVKYCIGVGNGFDAINLTLKAFGVGAGSQVIVPAHTFIATWLAVSNLGAKPVPVEPDLKDYNILPEKIESAITGNTKAIIVTHMYGHPVDMDKINAIAKKYSLPVIEDAAQAHGAIYKESRSGALGNAGAFSFYPTKNLGAFGDGGAVTTDDEKIADKIYAFRNYGAANKDNHKYVGVNSRLDELQAAFLRVKLKNIDNLNQRKQLLADRYIKGLADVDGVQLPYVSELCDHVWHLFVIQTDIRDKLKKLLEKDGIKTMIHYPKPVYTQEVYGQRDILAENFPINENLTKRILSLPIDPFMTEGDVDYVISRIKYNLTGR